MSTDERTPRQDAEDEYNAARAAYVAASERYEANPTPANKGLVTKANNRLSAAYSAREEAIRGTRL